MAELHLPNVNVSSVLPDDARFQDLCVSNNARWVANPELITLPGAGGQVAELVQQAIDAKRKISVRSGGHCYTDFVLNRDVKAVIDVSRLTDVSFDPQVNAFMVEPGNTLLETYKKLYRGWGTTIPGGMCYSVGVGGHIVGGGYGLLSRRYGSTVDHLHAVEVVCVSEQGQARTIFATSDPSDSHHDLWWAHTGGGGGNFGIVTKYWFRSPGAGNTSRSETLIRAPRSVLVSIVAIPWGSINDDRFHRVVDAFGRWHEEHRGAERPEADLCSFLMMNHRVNGSMGLLTVIDADAPNARETINRYVSDILDPADLVAQDLVIPVGEFGAMPGFKEPQEMPWLHAMMLLGTNNPTLTSPCLRGDHKSAYMKSRFTDDQIGTLYKSLTRPDHLNPQSMVVLLSYGGQINQREAHATASPQRSSAFKALFQSFWEDEHEDANNIAWTREVFNSVFVRSGGYPAQNKQTDGCYINYPDADIRNPAVNRSGVPWHTLYYGSNYDRLLQVKQKYDPLNLFSHSQSIGS